MTNELKEWFNSKVEEIVTTVKGEVKVSEDVAEQTAITVNLGDNEEITNKISEFEAKNIELSNKISLLEGELVSEKGNNETLTVEVEGLNAKINKADAKGTELETSSDPAIVENKSVDANMGFYNMIAGRIKTTFNN
jgi:regulator of replication initiation timing